MSVKRSPATRSKRLLKAAGAQPEDGPLLILAQEQFDVFVTIDSNLEHQQNLKSSDSVSLLSVFEATKSIRTCTSLPNSRKPPSPSAPVKSFTSSVAKSGVEEAF